MANRNRVELSLPPVAKVAVALGGLLLVAVLAVLIAVLVSLEGTRSELRTTRQGVVETEARLQRVTGQLAPLLDAARPLADGDRSRTRRQLSTALDELPALAGRARQGVDAAVFLAQDVRDADLGGTLRAVRALADAGLGGDRLARLIDTGQAALGGVEGQALGRAVSQADRVLVDLSRPGSRSIEACDDRLRREAPAAEGQVACLLRTVPNLRALLRDQLRANRRSVGTQQSQLSVNRRQLQLFTESIAIQRQLLVHLRSLDRKTGGTAPSTPAGP